MSQVAPVWAAPESSNGDTYEEINLCDSDASTDGAPSSTSSRNGKRSARKRDRTTEDSGGMDSLATHGSPDPNTHRKRKAQNKMREEIPNPFHRFLNSCTGESSPPVEDLSKDDESDGDEITATAKTKRRLQNGSRSSPRRKAHQEVDLSTQDDDEEVAVTQRKGNNESSPWMEHATSIKERFTKARQKTDRAVHQANRFIDSGKKMASQHRGTKMTTATGDLDPLCTIPALKKRCFLPKTTDEITEYSSDEEDRKPSARKVAQDNSLEVVSRVQDIQNAPFDDSHSRQQMIELSRNQSRRNAGNKNVSTPPARLSEGSPSSTFALTKVNNRAAKTAASTRVNDNGWKSDDTWKEEKEEKSPKKRRKSPRTYGSSERSYYSSGDFQPSRRMTRSSAQKKKKDTQPETIELLSSDDESPEPELVASPEVSKLFRISQHVDYLIMQLGVGAEVCLPDSSHTEIGTLFCKFDDEFDLDGFLRDSGLKAEKAPLESLDENIAYMVQINSEVLIRRNAPTPLKRKDYFLKGKNGDDILLVYPFTDDQTILDEAAKDLPDFSVATVDESREPPQSSSNDSGGGGRQRSHAVTVRVEDYERLEPLTWLNDSLVDFFMLWISRGMENVKTSDVHFFTSHFFSTLAKTDGASEVTSWTAKKGIDIFKKKLIFIPINRTMHWSLCVVVNPGEIEDYEPGDRPDDRMPCLLFFDSLKMHNVSYAKRKILPWLNSEWKRLRHSDGPFTNINLRVYTPKGMHLLPRQDNGSDCGVFVCRYALGMYKLRHLDFTEYQAFPDGVLSNKRVKRAAFKEDISEAEGFNFDVDDIPTMRKDFQTLIQELSRLYQRGLKEKKATAAAAKKEGPKSDESDDVATLKSDEDVEEPLTQRPSETTEKDLTCSGKTPPLTGEENRKDGLMGLEGAQFLEEEFGRPNNDAPSERAHAPTHVDEATEDLVGGFQKLHCTPSATLPPQADDEESADGHDTNIPHSHADKQWSLFNNTPPPHADGEKSAECDGRNVDLFYVDNVSNSDILPPQATDVEKSTEDSDDKSILL
ncbi:MAG: hypothetical protein SGILL_006613 [Bacillariaceae sp.]